MNRAFMVIFLAAVAYAIYAAVHENLHPLTFVGVAGILSAMLLVLVGSRGKNDSRRSRTSGDSENEPLVSFVVLLSRPRSITESDIRDRLQRIFGEPFGDQQTDANLVKQFRSDMVGVQVHGWKYGIISRPERYTRDEPPDIDKLDARLRLALRQHQAWLSVDAFGEASEVPQLAYPTMGKILAEFVDDSALAVYGTDTGRMMYVTEHTADLLRSGHPLEALQFPEPPVVQVEGDDPRMQVSVAEARQRWPEFVAAFGNKHPGQGFSVKAPFTDGQTIEYMWIEVDRLDDLTITGRLSNQPKNLTHLKLNDPVTINQTDMQDWLYEGPRGIEGGFSVRVIREMQER